MGAEPDVHDLRAIARERLRDAATVGSSTVLGAPAMAALLRLAASVDHNADALVLQQELRIHQIEIDLLRESLQADEGAGDARGGTPG